MQCMYSHATIEQTRQSKKQQKSSKSSQSLSSEKVLTSQQSSLSPQSDDALLAEDRSTNFSPLFSHLSNLIDVSQKCQKKSTRKRTILILSTLRGGDPS